MVKGFRQKLKKNFATDLKKRNEESSARSKSKFGSVFKKDLIKIPFWKCGEGEHVMDIVPFFAGKQHPNVDKDEVAYNIDLYVHQNVGVLNKQYVCPAWNWSKPCPICEYIEDNRGLLDKAEWSAKRAKRRAIYFVWMRTTPKDESNGLQIFEIAHFFMEEKLDSIKKSPRGGGAVILGNPDTSPLVIFERRGTGFTNTQYLGHRFEARSEPMPDSILDQTFSLDEVIDMHPDYDEIYTAFHGASKDTPKVKEEPVEEVEDDDDINDDMCPAGGEYGIDTDELEDCTDCEVYDNCAAALIANRPKAKAKVEEEVKPRTRRLRRK